MRVALLLLATAQALSPPYVQQVFSFPFIPYSVALRHIHSPEHFVQAHALCPPAFRILHTNPPTKGGRFDALHFTFTAALCGVRFGSVFASEPASSQLLLLDEDRTPYLLATLSVKPEARGGHRLLVTGSYLRPPRCVVDRLYQPAGAKAVQDAIQTGYRSTVEDSNLREYRKRVLRL